MLLKVGLEARSSVGHNVVQPLGAAHVVDCLYLLQDLRVGHARVGELAVHDDLVEHDPEQPHVRLHCEAVVEDGFGGRPHDGKFGPRVGLVDILVDNPNLERPAVCNLLISSS